MTWVEGPAGRLPVGKILCLIRNYAPHAAESGAEVPETPLYFLKPSTALVHDGGTVRIPPEVGDLQAEGELGVVVGRRLREVAASEALGHVLGYVAFLDMTARDLQRTAMREGLPWSRAKGMDTFAPVSGVRPAEAVPDPHDLAFRLRVNGEVRQRASTAEMVHRIPAALAFISRTVTLEPGDILATGTPAGVPSVGPGDDLELEVEKVGALRVRVARR